MMSSAKIGALIWLVVTIRALLEGGLHTPVEIIFQFAPLVIVPLGLNLSRNRSHTPGKLSKWVAVTQPVGAIIVAYSFWFSPAAPAGYLTSWWSLAALLIACDGLLLFAQDRTFSRFVRGCSGLFLLGGSGWLVASRMGATPMGFQEPIVLLTAVHFHFTGFATPLLLDRLGNELAGAAQLISRVATSAALLATPLIAAGFVYSPTLKIFAIFLLVASLTLGAVLSLRVARNVAPALSRFFLRVSAVSIVAGMALALLYGIGEYTGRSLIGLAEMAIYHGITNALGFTLCGLLAWNLLEPKEALW